MNNKKSIIPQKNVLDVVNTNKFFIGLMMITLNIGSKYVSIQTSKSMEEYMKMNISKQLLIFSMCFLGTRCLITSILLTAGFVVLSDHLFNEESDFCCVPQKYRIMHTIPTTNDVVTEDEYKKALEIVDKYKKNKAIQEQRSQYISFFSSLN